MTSVRLDDGLIQGDSVAALLDSAMDAGGGLLRLTPTWVPRSFLHPGRRIKLHPKTIIASVRTAVALMNAGSEARLRRPMVAEFGMKA